jgi:hypothetical protein
LIGCSVATDDRDFLITTLDDLRWHDIYKTISMKIATGVQETLRVCLRNVRGSNIDITEKRAA